MAIESRPPDRSELARLWAAVTLAYATSATALVRRGSSLVAPILDRLTLPLAIAAAALLPLLLVNAIALRAALVLLVLVFVIERAVGWWRPNSSFTVEKAGAAERTARQNEASVWSKVVDASPDAAIALGPDHVLEHFNSAARDILPRVRTGVPVAHVTRDPELLAAIGAVAVEPLGGARTIVMRDRVPLERRIAARIVAIGHADDVPLRRILVSFRDLTEQDRLTEMRTDFIANASHELRTPLASLRGFVETLQGPARDDPAARDRFLSIMAAQAARMTRLIDDLLSLSRIEMHAHLPPKGHVDLGDVVTFVTRELEPIARAAKITLHIEPTQQPALVRGDRDELVQVFQNLVQNAIKYGHTNGNVWVRLARDGASGRSMIVATVSDDGPGIAAEHIPRLTERFYRVNVSASREKGGTGLGLAIVKHIVNRHGGELRIASTPGQGSSFSASFAEIS